ERAADSVIRCRCGPFFFPRWFVRADLRTGTSVSRGVPRDSAQVGARIRAVRSTLEHRARGRDRLISAGADAQGPWLLVGRALFRNADSVFVGVEADLDSLRRQWDFLARSLPAPLVPSDTLGEVVTTELLLRDSTAIFRHGRVSDGLRAT